MKKTRLFFLLTVVLGCFAAIGLMNIPSMNRIKSGDIRSMEDVEDGNYQSGDLVKGTIECCVGCCAEEYKTNWGIRTSKSSDKLYYVILLNNDKYMVLCTSDKDEYRRLDTLYDETIEYFEQLVDEEVDYESITPPVSTMSFEGQAVSIPSDIVGYFKEWYDEYAAYEGSVFESECEMLMLRSSEFDGINTMVYVGIGCGAAAVLCLILAIIFVIKSKRDEVYGY